MFNRKEQGWFKLAINRKTFTVVFLKWFISHFTLDKQLQNPSFPITIQLKRHFEVPYYLQQFLSIFHTVAESILNELLTGMKVGNWISTSWNITTWNICYCSFTTIGLSSYKVLKINFFKSFLGHKIVF